MVSYSKVPVVEVPVARFSSHYIVTVSDSTPPLVVGSELLKTKAILLFTT